MASAKPNLEIAAGDGALQKNERWPVAPRCDLFIFSAAR
jgi:hypothetical protein